MSTFSFHLRSILWALALLESGINHDAVGDFDVRDRPRARGAWQLHLSAWRDVHPHLGPKTSKQDWEIFAHDPVRASEVAARYWKLCEAKIECYTHAKPTLTQIYCAWNLGPTKFIRKYKCKVSSVPSWVRQRARKFEQLVGQYR